MNEKFNQLYQKVVMEHARTPHNFGELEGFSTAGEGDNPMCGDSFKVFVRLSDDVVTDVTFTGAGCAVSKSSASVMTEQVKGKTITEIKALFEQFQELVNGEVAPEDADEKLGDLLAFAGIAEFPVRIQCATLAWEALTGALS